MHWHWLVFAFLFVAISALCIPACVLGRATRSIAFLASVFFFAEQFSKWSKSIWQQCQSPESEPISFLVTINATAAIPFRKNQSLIQSYLQLDQFGESRNGVLFPTKQFDCKTRNRKFYNLAHFMELPLFCWLFQNVGSKLENCS